MARVPRAAAGAVRCRVSLPARPVAAVVGGWRPRRRAAAGAERRALGLQSAEALARLRHPQVVRVHSVGEHRGAPYLVMDLIQGESLADRLARLGPLPVAEALRITRLLCQGLSHVHAQGLVHRDLKPENVMLGDFGEVMLMDWGLAAAVTDNAKADRLDPEHAFGGTPAYMMGGWHLFMQNSLQRFLLPRVGAFSVGFRSSQRASRGPTVS